ncbi:MAG: class I SAM-dependent rRNA methyltransferase [Aquificae bacterium]|nr:class I SAM-dependent rRNA methyltransferase [Aquificota bacterium]
MKKVILKKSGERAVLSFSQWIYQNQIKKYPPNIQKGEAVEVYSPDGRFLGVGYFNPESKIPLRILSFFEKKSLEEIVKERIPTAIQHRKELNINSNGYRVIHSEGDFLSGLVVDYYDGYLSIQINTAGMERLREVILNTLIKHLSPKGIIDKSDEKVRQKEGLPTENKVIYGEIPDRVIIQEYGVKFAVHLKEGQKTGFFLDQRQNRKVVANYIKEGFKVLDLFSNAGGFGIHAGKKGASFVKFVDISTTAVSQIKENCKLNNITNYQIVEGDVFDFLKEEREKGERYNLIVIDPPSFAKTHREKEGGLRGFKYLILNSIKLLEKKGYIAVFSCSYHIQQEDLIKVSIEASKDTKTQLRITEFMYQDKDHPVLLNMPNTLYLKGLLLERV